MDLSNIKAVVLVSLCVQNASHALLARYAQGYLKEQFSSTDVVLVAEAIKCIVSALFVVSDSSTDTEASGSGVWKLLWLLRHGQHTLLLVVLYSAANLLSYYALARVDAAVYAVLAQLKILSTAAFSVWLLRRSFSWTKWRALLLLVMGCVLVASPALHKTPSADAEHDAVDVLEGIAAILALVCISGYSAVYFENMLKAEKHVTIWERNFQLAVYSVLLLLMMIVGGRSVQGEAAAALFEGWTANASLLAVLSAAGGLLVAATLKYADSVLKTLATSGSIVLSAVLGHALLGAELDVFVTIGCLATILAICNYTFEEVLPVLPTSVGSAAALPANGGGLDEFKRY